MINLNIFTIPQAAHRYDTCGDWDAHQIRVTDMGNALRENLVAFHEYAEKIICDSTGVKEEDVTAFDMAYEASRTIGAPPLAPCGCSHYDEPGDDPHAPYYKAHQVATIVEHVLAVELNVNWVEYNSDIEG